MGHSLDLGLLGRLDVGLVLETVKVGGVRVIHPVNHDVGHLECTLC